jgi:hypothetical protein
VSRPAVHPGPSAYNKGCRCGDCTELHRQRHNRVMAWAAATASPERIPHGIGGYGNWGCRCAVCLEAGRAKNALSRARVKTAAGKPLTAREAAAVASAWARVSGLFLGK